MQQYTFEYTRQRDGYILLGTCIAMIFVGIGVLVSLHLTSTALAVSIAALVALSIIFFISSKHRIKRIGSAELSGERVLIQLESQSEIDFKQLRYYYIYDGKNGIAFTLGFKDDRKFKLTANNNFCNTALLRLLLVDVQTAIEAFNSQEHADVIHLKSVLARRNAVYVLIALTILVIIGFCFTHMPLMILPISATLPLLLNWIIYFQLKSRGELTDI